MKTDCCYALQDKAWVRDPDGNEWEVFVVLRDTAFSNASCCSEKHHARNHWAITTTGVPSLEVSFFAGRCAWSSFASVRESECRWRYETQLARKETYEKARSIPVYWELREKPDGGSPAEKHCGGQI
jgi:hypothetical protein